MEYNKSMRTIDEDTEIVGQQSAKEVNHVKVAKNGSKVDLLLLHELETTGGHVDKAEIVAVWHFDSLAQLQFQADIIKKIVSDN